MSCFSICGFSGAHDPFWTWQKYKRLNNTTWNDIILRFYKTVIKSILYSQTIDVLYGSKGPCYLESRYTSDYFTFWKNNRWLNHRSLNIVSLRSVWRSFRVNVSTVIITLPALVNNRHYRSGYNTHQFKSSINISCPSLHININCLFCKYEKCAYVECVTPHVRCNVMLRRCREYWRRLENMTSRGDLMVKIKWLPLITMSFPTKVNTAI